MGRIFNVHLEISGQLVDGDDDINDHNDHVEITFEMMMMIQLHQTLLQES